MSPQEISTLERRVLQALCALASAREAQAQAAQFEGYSWLDPEHKIVFEALQRLPTRATKAWRDELPAQATRMGFPDVEWKLYFRGKRRRREDLKKWIAALKRTPAKKP